MNNNRYQVEFNGCTFEADCIGVLEGSLSQEIYDYLNSATVSDPHAERDIEEWAENLFYRAMENLLITCGKCDSVNNYTYENHTVCKCGHELYASPVISKKGE